MNNKNTENFNEMFNTVFQLLDGSVGTYVIKQKWSTNESSLL